MKIKANLISERDAPAVVDEVTIVDFVVIGAEVWAVYVHGSGILRARLNRFRVVEVEA